MTLLLHVTFKLQLAGLRYPYFVRGYGIVKLSCHAAWPGPRTAWSGVEGSCAAPSTETSISIATVRYLTPKPSMPFDWFVLRVVQGKVRTRTRTSTFAAIAVDL